MYLKTKHFGTIEIDEKEIIFFPEGVPGFEDVKKFVIISDPDDVSHFKWLQGVDNTDLAFVIINPKVIKPDYVVDIEDDEVEVLDIQDVNQVLVYCIVVVPEDISKIRANLKAPVIINKANMRGKQVVMEKDDYPMRYYFYERFKVKGEDEEEKEDRKNEGVGKEEAEDIENKDIEKEKIEENSVEKDIIGQTSPEEIGG
ncbi:MAG: flagellar assembly protein FliW [Clostridiales bacterium]|nr:flagellar assembly protein FliW [Clostridiales bacterium]